MTDTPMLPRRHLSPEALSQLKRFTDARIALGQAGAGLPTEAVLGFALDHARARDAIGSELNADALTEALRDGDWPLLAHSAVTSRQEYLTRPNLGRRLSDDTAAHLSATNLTCDLCIVVADGLSALAVNENAVGVIQALCPLLPPEMTVGTVLLRNGRVAAGDRIALALGAKAVLILIGERPGLSAADSLGAYLTWAPREDTRDAERFCVSNIRKGGLTLDAAARQIAALLDRSRIAGRSGVAIADGR
ncbi:ethanolamine ammonia-lyase subunit EutC [Donghicola mangrovi]|nr:ethanolamine ammonia-lyase subunit EutC [Donghicola mangrovi]